MAKQTKTRKPVSARTKGLICLLVLCVLTVAASVLALNGWRSGENGMNVLLPWVPVKPAEWPASLPLTRALDGGTYTDYTVTLAEGETLDTVIKSINAHLDGIGETDHRVTALDDETIRVEVRRMDDSRLSFMRGLTQLKGQLSFSSSSGAAVLSEKDMDRGTLGVNNAQTAYVYRYTLTEEGVQKVTDSGSSFFYAALDGDRIGYGSVSGNVLTLTLANSNYITYLNLVHDSGTVYSTTALKGMGDVPASAGSAKTVVFFIGAALILCALVYLCLTRKLTGLAGAWTVWCAVLLGLFFVATLVVLSVYALNVVCLIAVLLGILLAVYTAVTRADAINANIREGLSPKQASRLGFKSSMKQIWIAHGGAIALALILMLIPAAKSAGYTLAAMVCGSAITVVLMRAFQGCFTAITSKASLFGKTK